MIRRIFLCICALCVLCVGAYAQPDYQSSFVRLHVVAMDNTPEAQAVKLAVRDACLECAETYLADCDDAQQAYETLQDKLEEFQSAAEDAAEEMGFAGDVALELGTFEFPDRIYGELRVPAGEYRALRVTLGAGEGHNWWCVLYPSLCGLDEAEYAAADGEITFYSSIWRWLKRLFGGADT